MFCAPGHIFGGAEGIRSHFHVFRARTRFRLSLVRRVPFSCVFTPVLVFGSTDVFGSRFHVLRSCTRFRRFRGRRVPFSCFARPYSFLAVARALGPVFLFCAPGLIFDGTEGVGSRFHVLRSRTLVRRFRGRRVSLSCFARSDSFSAVPRALGPVFVFCAPGLVFDGTEGVPSRFNVFCSRICFRR
jgi:hypothetical protein